MAKAKTENTDYSTRLAAHQADDTLDKTVTGGDAMFATDATNVALEAYDPQPHAESHLPVLSPSNPGTVKNEALANAGNA